MFYRLSGCWLRARASVKTNIVTNTARQRCFRDSSKVVDGSNLCKDHAHPEEELLRAPQFNPTDRHYLRYLATVRATRDSTGWATPRSRELHCHRLKFLPQFEARRVPMSGTRNGKSGLCAVIPETRFRDLRGAVHARFCCSSMHT
jgi:hypothetical protein